MEIKKVHYGNFGECVSISNGQIELLVTTELGPRVISLSRTGMENIFFRDFDLAADGQAVFSCLI